MKKLFTKLTMLLFAMAMSLSMMAADQIVTSNSDSGAGTLRQAIIEAGDGDVITIDLASGNEIISISSQLTISESLTIDGSNVSGIAVTVQVTTPYNWNGTSGNVSATASRVFHILATVSGKTVNLSNMTIKGGDISSNTTGEDGYGCGIFIEDGVGHQNIDVIIDGVTVSGSKAFNGGGIYAQQGTTVEISNSTISLNITADGLDSTGEGNPGGDGGGIYSDEATFTVTNSTLSSNRTGVGDNAMGANNNGGKGGSGGGIYSNGGSFTLNNSTLFSNTTGAGGTGSMAIGNGGAGGDGGGIYSDGADFTVTNSTLSSNRTGVGGTGAQFGANGADGNGGGIYCGAGTITAKNTILADNYRGSGTSTGDDYYYYTGTLTDYGYNIVEFQDGASSGTGKTFTATTDILWDSGDIKWEQDGTATTSQDLNLSSSLADNGGSTQTLVVSSGSFAISAGVWDASITTDQRGESRRQYNPTIGAYEPNNYNQTWTGTTTTSWSTASNWSPSSVPTANDNITIPDVSGVSGNDPVIAYNGTADCGNLTINSGGSLTIESTSSGTGSLIVNGTASGNVTVKRFLTADKWHYISGQTNISDNFSTTMGLGTSGSSSNSFYRWDEALETNGTPGTWVDILNGPTGNGDDNDMVDTFDAGKGYAITYASSDKTLSLTGTPYDENKVITITNTENSTNRGANLVGNPFCSDIAINSNAQDNNFITQNSSVLHSSAQAVYLWDDTQEDYVAKSNIGEVYAEPGQGFMVLAKDEGAPHSLEFNINIRKHGSTTFYKTNDEKSLELMIKDSENRINTTTIAFLPDMTIGLDPSYDAMKLKGNPNIALYTRLIEDNGTDFAIQALNDTDIENYVIPVGVDVAEENIVEFSISQTNLDRDVYLEDKLLNKSVNLSEQNYTANIINSGIGRFFLHFAPVGIEEPITKPATISTYASNNMLYILNPEHKQGTVTIFNLTGQQVTTFDLTGDTKQQHNVHSKSEVINIVKILTKDEAILEKVIFR